MTEPLAVVRPGPTVTAVTAPYWEGLRREQLLLQACRACGARQHYPRAICASCWSQELAWEPARGLGRVWTFTVVHRPGHPAWQDEVPYAVLVVALDEGPRVVAALPDGHDRVAIGARVRLGYRHLESFSLLVCDLVDLSDTEPTPR